MKSATDSLRGFSIIMIVFAHICQYEDSLKQILIGGGVSYKFIFSWGAIGVGLFFFLSGLGCYLSLNKGDKNELLERVSKRRVRRLETQPLDMPSAGSVFRNPIGMHAGELIEKCGLKGFSIGDAQVSEKHANFIVNTGNATGIEIIHLIDRIKREVKDKFDVDLVLEQIIIE